MFLCYLLGVITLQKSSLGWGKYPHWGLSAKIDLIFATGNIYVKEGVIGGIFMFNGWGVVLNNIYNSY